MAAAKRIDTTVRARDIITPTLLVPALAARGAQVARQCGNIPSRCCVNRVMKITIEPTGDVAQLANASQGSVWTGVTETGTPVIAIVVTLGCRPEHQREFDRDFGDAKAEPPAEAIEDDAVPDAPRPLPA